MDKNIQVPSKLIALVSNSTWTLYNFRIDLIRFLIASQYRVLVIAAPDDFAALLQSEGCEYCPVQFDNRSENPLQDIKLFWQLKKIYRQYSPDLIFHYVIKPNIYGSLAAAATGLRSVAVITGLGYSFAKKNWLYHLVKLLYRRALRHAKEVWFLNNEDARIFNKEKIVDIERIKVLPGEGVNTAFFSPGPREHTDSDKGFHFLMSTRLLKSKGVKNFADAARIMRKKFQDVRFELIGFFEKSHPDTILEEELIKWQKEGLVNYKGFVRDVRPFLQSADCFVFPSYYNEGIPRSLMEAASMELPIITSVNRGCKEVVEDHVNGFLCRQNDPFDLAEKMEVMIKTSWEERRQMGRKGRSLVMEKFNVEKVIHEYERILKDL